MNGMAASDKIFTLLDLPEDAAWQRYRRAGCRLRACHCRDLRFGSAAEEGRDVLHGLNPSTSPAAAFTALVGESGCGKSYRRRRADRPLPRATPAARPWAGGELSARAAESALLQHRDARSACGSHSVPRHRGREPAHGRAHGRRRRVPCGTVLERRCAWRASCAASDGLDTPLDAQGGSNLSGGQRQRLALARALLHDSPVYVFDEATSNIDVESENDIMAQIQRAGQAPRRSSSSPTAWPT